MKIQDLTITNVQDTSVEISWRTSVPATTKVKYGEELAAVIYNRQTPENDSYTFDHSVLLLDLKPETTYHFKTVAASRDGELVESEDKSFTTMKEGQESGSQTGEVQGFAVLMSPAPPSRALGASSSKAPRLNPYADVLGQYDALTPTPYAGDASSSHLYSYPNYQGGYPYPPVAVVYPPNYAPQTDAQPQVLAQQTSPTPTLTLEPTVVPVESGGGSFDGDANSLLLLLGVILGIIVAGLYWRFNQGQESSEDSQEKPKTYEFSIG